MAIVHGSVIWVTELGANRAFKVRTTEGLAIEYGGDPAALGAENSRDGRPLTDVLEIADGYEAALEIQNSKGQQVPFDDVIEIEGRKYLVQRCSSGEESNEIELVLQQ
jgi:hypothetical protein